MEQRKSSKGWFTRVAALVFLLAIATASRATSWVDAGLVAANYDIDVHTINNGVATVVQSLTGGNDCGHQRMDLTTTAYGDTTTTYIAVRKDWAYAPATAKLNSVTFSFDACYVNTGLTLTPRYSYYFVVRQAGKYYLAISEVENVPDPYAFASFHTRALTAADFRGYSFASGFDNTHPDFSVSGVPMYFGFQEDFNFWGGYPGLHDGTRVDNFRVVLDVDRRSPSLSVDPEVVDSEGFSTALLKLSQPAPIGGLTVSLSASNPSMAQVPPTLKFGPGKSAATFRINTSTVSVRDQVVVSALLGDLPAQVALTVEPTNGTEVPGADILLKGNFTDANPAGVTVDGIVCDNSRCTPMSELDHLDIRVDPKYAVVSVRGDFVDSAGKRIAPTPQMGTLAPVGTKVVFNPPLEFNLKQTPATLLDLNGTCVRSVRVRVTFLTSDGKWYRGYRSVFLARTPMVLVHGINNKPEDHWKPFWTKVETGQNFRNVVVSVPMTASNHYTTLHGNGFSGKGRVENAAAELSRTISYVLSCVRQGNPISWCNSRGDTRWPDFTGYSNPKRRLAIKRVDVVAHSYGGCVARWYLADRSGDGAGSLGWYKYLPFNAGEAETPVAYRGDVRKLITLGSMWRGVPLCNVLNEISATAQEQRPFGDAPILGTQTRLRDWIETVAKVESVRCPTWQVMATDSLWQQFLLYGRVNPGINQPAAPFRSSVAYGSVAGNNSGYYAPYGINALEASTQAPSWFPYLGIEHKGLTNVGDFSDGLVPVWSACLPGPEGSSYRLVDGTHSDIPTEDGTIEYVMCMLNSTSLPTGPELTVWWNGAQNFREWAFDHKGYMAPYPMNLAYDNVGGMGRLNPVAVREVDDIGATGDRSLIIVRFRTVWPVTSGRIVIRRNGHIVKEVPLANLPIAGWHDLPPVPNTWGSGQFSATVMWTYDSTPVGAKVSLTTVPRQFVVD